MASNKITLDVDPTIIEKNLLLDDLKTDELDSLISNLNKDQLGSGDDRPGKLIKPSPGFVVKTRSETGEKIFLNICHTDAIPPPRDVTDEELIAIQQSDDMAPDYRLPMSIGNLHVELDKSGAASSVFDIAINTSFFHKVETNQLFRSFLITVALEGVARKHEVDIDTSSKSLDIVILKNRKVMGELQYHMIENRGKVPEKVLIKEVKAGEITGERPRFRIIRDPPHGSPELLTVQVHVKDVSSGKTLLLDVGEDRLVLRSSKKTGSLLDIFLPYSVDHDRTCAHFDLDTQILSVELPVLN